MSPRHSLFLGLLLAVAAPLLSGCAEDDEVIDFDLPISQSGMAMSAAGVGPQGLSATAVNGADTEVWKVTRRWEAVEGEAGMAWSAGSGLNWEGKYAAWIAEMEETARHQGSGTTFTVITPYGRELPIPYLECAELAMAMRVLFASWYGLPFYMEAVDGTGTRIFAGHFGFRTSAGRYKNSARYKSLYNDYSNLSQADIDGTWPQDSKLRGRAIYGGQDDNEFLGAGAKSGWYFDELLLNKRTGYFLLNLLPFFGSINLADDANAYHVVPTGIRSGDILLKRWQKRGIGHVMLVKSVDARAGGKLTATLASGSMPRRQAVWESPAASKMLFTNDKTGGEGEAYGGEAYVELGGGLKRWPAPTVVSGFWRNRVVPADMANFLRWDQKTERAARPAQFEDLLVTPSPEVLRDELLAIIESKRDWLRDHPSSCSARTAREEAFEQLYDLMQEKFGLPREQVDLQYRELEDYVFAELSYEQSRTCCWNSTTTAMSTTVMSWNSTLVESGTGGACVEPDVFMMVDGGYQVFASHAAELGTPWVAWSADESCPQASTVTTDTEATHGWTPWCELESLRGETETNPPAGADPYEPNDRWQEAYVLPLGDHTGARITENDRDWFRIEPNVGALVRFSISFDHGAGDLDIEMYEGDTRVDSSAGTGSTETVDHTWSGEKPLMVKVYGYSGAQNPYTISVTATGGVDLGDPCNDNNETMATALELGLGFYPGLGVCANDVDWFRIPATTGSFVARVEWGSGAGPFRVELFRSNNESAGTVTSGAGWAEVQSGAGLRFLRVQGVTGSTGTYSLRIQ